MAAVLPPSLQPPLALLTVLCTVTSGFCLSHCSPLSTSSINSPLYSNEWLLYSPLPWPSTLHPPLAPLTVLCTVTRGCCLAPFPPTSTCSNNSPLYSYEWLLSSPLPSTLHLLHFLGLSPSPAQRSRLAQHFSRGEQGYLSTYRQGSPDSCCPWTSIY